MPAPIAGTGTLRLTAEAPCAVTLDGDALATLQPGDTTTHKCRRRPVPIDADQRRATLTFDKPPLDALDGEKYAPSDRDNGHPHYASGQ
jgi:hypothetical protein